MSCQKSDSLKGNRLDKATRNAVLEKIPYGLYVVGAKTKDGVATIIANWICQVSFNPTLVSVAIEFESEMRAYIEESKFFSVNILHGGSVEFAKAFLKKSKQADSLINGKEMTLTDNGTPFLLDALASFECKVVDAMKSGDHTLFLGEVIDVILNGAGESLTLKETGWKYSRWN
jgi:flavin reductase (DIM6/NTAB) family NADH-FMN oxidoreductase RutF